MAGLLKSKAALHARAKLGALAVGTIDTFLIWRLSGGISHVTDVSNASRTQLMNLRTGRWDDELLRIFGVPSSILAEIKTSSGELAVTKGLKFLPDGIPVSGVVGVISKRHCSGKIVSTKVRASVTFGNGEVSLMNTGSERVTSKSGLLTTAAWQLKGDKQIILRT